MKVIKFGGSSIGTPERFINVAKIISGKAEKDNIIVVLSAIGGITDKLLEAIKFASTGDSCYTDILEEIESVHFHFLSKVVTGKHQQETLIHLNKIFGGLIEKLKGVSLLKECSPRIWDSIVPCGEYLSNILMISTLKSFGLTSQFHDARNLIRTDSNYGDATVNFNSTNRLIREWFKSLGKNQIPIVNGFTGANEKGDTTTLGRSGSDFTATIIGGALNASIVEIWTDVNGVLTADPKLVPSAISLDELGYNEASSLALLGGKVIHPKTIAPVEKENVPISILNTFRPEARGTLIGKITGQNELGIKTITYLHGISSISIFELESKYSQKFFARLLGLIARLEIPIITISKAAYNQSVSFIVQSEFQNYFLEEINREFVLEIDNGFIGKIISKSNLSLISAIGVGGEYYSSVIRKIHDVLENNSITSNMFLNDPGASNISFIVDEEDVKKTVGSLHKEFFEENLAANVA